MICNIASYNIKFDNIDVNKLHNSINIYPFLFYKNVNNSQIDLTCKIKYEEFEPPTHKLIFEDDNGLFVYKDKNLISFRFYSNDDSYILGFTFYENENICVFYIDRKKILESNVHIIESTPFQLCFMIFLINNGAIILHSNCIMINNYTYCFTGESGAGKSTLCKLFNNYTDYNVLTDEVTILKLVENKIFAYGSPWKGSGSFFADNVGKELNKIYFIYHGKSNYTKRVSKNKALEMLLKQSFPFFWDRSKVMQAIKIINKIINLTDYDDFYFSPDKSALKYLEEKEDINIKFSKKEEKNKLDEWFDCIKNILNQNKNKKYPIDIIGNSMYPYFKNGDKINVVSIPEDGLRIDDVIVYKKGKNNITVHRVIDILHINNEKIYITKGDNNPFVDSYNITDTNVIGIVEEK